MTYQRVDLMRHLRDRAFDSLLRWILLVAVICFGAVILWDYGFLGYMFANDTSGISSLILAVFTGFSFYCLYVLVDHSRELRAVERISSELEAGASLGALEDTVKVGETIVPAQLMASAYLRDIAIKRQNDPGSNLDVLTQSFASRLRRPGRSGIFVADMLYKLGMLGTVIGFIAMLASMRDLGEFDVETMRAALQQMTGGMAVALLTTIAGLVCGLLLRMQFNILDGLSMHVLRRVVRLTELFLTGQTGSKG